MTRRLIVANWKMHPERLKDARALFSSVKRSAARLRRTTLVICPSAPHLGALAPHAGLSGGFALGAQDLSAVSGEETGGVSPYALRDLGARFVIVGHSERRALGESDEDVARKTRAAQKAGLTPIVCVGESERDAHGSFLRFLEAQIKLSLAGIPRARARQLVIAYEPLWAIGGAAADAMTPHVLHETSLFIRKVLSALFGKQVGFSIPILYGGSVEASNAAHLLSEGAVAGLLVGHASLDAKGFSRILRAIDAVK